MLAVSLSATGSILLRVNEQRDLSDALDDLDRKIAEHPAYREYLELEALELSLIAVFRPNFVELVRLLDAASTEVDLAFELIQNVHPPVVRDRFHAEVTQRLHNYLAGTYSLREHVSRLMRDRSGPIVDEFHRRKAEVAMKPEVRFVQDLRTYAQHRALPFLGHRLSMKDQQAELESEVNLGVRQLLEWDGWSSPGRAYLEAVDEVVPLRPVIKTHAEVVFTLNAWLHAELAKTNDAPLDEVNELIVARNALLTGGDFDAAERASRYGGLT